MKTIFEKESVFGPRTFTQNEQGQWTMEIHEWGMKELVTEAEVIDALKNSKNWKDIKIEHFPMHGFHS